MSRRNALIAIVLGVAALSLSACKNSPPPTVEEVRPVHSLTLRAGQSSLGARYSGEVRARYESRLSFQLSGRIVERKVELGSHVKRGQGLMQLDASTQRLGVDSAMAQLEAARHRVEQSRLDLSRHEALVKANFISRSVLDQKRLALEETQAQLSAAQSQLGVAREQLGYTELRADRDGVITTLEVERGQVVAPGQAVLTLAADGEREVAINIPESRIDEVSSAKELTVALWAKPDSRYAATVREIAPDADAATRTYIARLSIKQPDASLRLGMTAAVAVTAAAEPSLLWVPLTAIHQDNSPTQVWVIDPVSSKVSPRPVKLGATRGNDVALIDGVKEGEIIVTAGVTLLHPGQKVLIADAPSNPAPQGAQR